jgi:GH15 family glucan-1,4-alpha-glucosidase
MKVNGAVQITRGYFTYEASFEKLMNYTTFYWRNGISGVRRVDSLRFFAREYFVVKPHVVKLSEPRPAPGTIVFSQE